MSLFLIQEQVRWLENELPSKKPTFVRGKVDGKYEWHYPYSSKPRCSICFRYRSNSAEDSPAMATKSRLK